MVGRCAENRQKFPRCLQAFLRNLRITHGIWSGPLRGRDAFVCGFARKTRKIRTNLPCELSEQAALAEYEGWSSKTWRNTTSCAGKSKLLIERCLPQFSRSRQSKLLIYPDWRPASRLMTFSITFWTLGSVFFGWGELNQPPGPTNISPFPCRIRATIAYVLSGYLVKL